MSEQTNSLSKAIASYISKSARSSDPVSLGARLAIIEDKIASMKVEADLVELGQDLDTLAAEIAVSSVKKASANDLVGRAVDVQTVLQEKLSQVRAVNASLAERQLNKDVQDKANFLVSAAEKAGVKVSSAFSMDNGNPCVSIVFATARKPEPSLVLKSDGQSQLVIGDYRSDLKLAGDEFSAVKKALLMRGYRV